MPIDRAEVLVAGVTAMFAANHSRVRKEDDTLLTASGDSGGPRAVIHGPNATVSSVSGVWGAPDAPAGSVEPPKEGRV